MDLLSRFSGHVLLIGLLLTPAARALESVESVEVASRTVTNSIRVDGTIEAINRATLRAQTSGRVKAVHYDVDDYITAGSVMIELENEQQRARLEQARAREQEARAAVDEARKNFERAEQLLEEGNLSRSDFDQTQAAFDRARARLEEARAAVKQARQQLSYTRVKAPYTSIVTERFIEEGELAQPGRKLIGLLSLDRIRVTATVPQQYVDRVREQKRLKVLLPGDTRVTSDDVTIYPRADSQSRTFRIRARIDPEMKGIYPGMFVKVRVITGERETLVIPESALLRQGELHAVYVLREKGTPRLRQVRTGERHDGSIEILSGLQAGETIAPDAREATRAAGAAQ